MTAARIPDDDRAARAVWSRLAEPADEAAGAMVAELGPSEALHRVRRGRGDARHPVRERWTSRWERVDPVRERDHHERSGGTIVVPGDPDWPSGLDDLGPARPFCLWVRGAGDLARVSAGSVAVVGARAATGYGVHVAGEIGLGCAAAGHVVVSGAAYGIDGAAHRGALATDGPTVAVLACGIDRAYPAGHAGLLDRIRGRGVVVSEMPPGSAPTRWRFLQRNRLIAAMTTATVVVEAARRSGALGTARRAIDLGRAVGAVPGPVTSAVSVGCHDLLRAGAVCVTGDTDALELVRPIGFPAGPDPEERGADGAVPARSHDGLSPELVRLLDAVPRKAWAEVASVADLGALTPGEALRGLGRLEARGLVERSPHGWRRARSGA